MAGDPNSQPGPRHATTPNHTQPQLKSLIHLRYAALHNEVELVLAGGPAVVGGWPG
jgi:hypothetical protein